MVIREITGGETGKTATAKIAYEGVVLCGLRMRVAPECKFNDGARLLFQFGH